MVIGKKDILKFLSDPFDIQILEAAFRNLDDISNPIRFNNFAYVLRELVNRVIDRLAPNKEVIAAIWWQPSAADKIANKANRRQQIRYALLDGNPEDLFRNLRLMWILLPIMYTNVLADLINTLILVLHISDVQTKRYHRELAKLVLQSPIYLVPLVNVETKLRKE